LPFTLDTFTHLFDWEKDPQRQEKIVNARLEAEFDGVDTALSSLAAAHTTAESGAAYTLKGRNAGTTGAIADIDISAITEKTAPLANNDLFLIQDSAASNAFKRVKRSNVSGGFQEDMVLYCVPGLALSGPISSAAFNFPGTAATANTRLWYASRMSRRLNLAHWSVALNHNAVGATNTEFELCHFPSGGGAVTQIAVLAANTSSPVSSGAFVTTELNNLLAAAADINIAHRTKGDGTNSPLIYSSVLHLVWE
jgi:hypothetical protein